MQTLVIIALVTFTITSIVFSVILYKVNRKVNYLKDIIDDWNDVKK